MAKLVDTYACVTGAAFAAASLILTDGNELDWRAGVGSAGAAFGCVSLMFPEASENVFVQAIITYKPVIDYAFCGFAVEALVHDLNELAEGKHVAGTTVADAFGSVTGCVSAKLGTLIKGEGPE
jgi:radical SAM superfamily enzyme YgiQ (UPF0313 family)